MATIKVIDGDGLAKYYEVIEDGTTGNAHQSVVPDYRLAWAHEHIRSSFGDDVSIWEKAKGVSKFGKNLDLDVGISETIWQTGGDETLKTANDIDIVVSTNAGDNQDVVIEGYTISGSDLTFVTQTATLNGTTNVTLTTPLARVVRLYNDDSTDFAGDVTVEDNGTSVHLTVKGTDGENQSEKCAFSVASNEYYIITQIGAGVVGTTSATVEFKFQIKLSGKVWRTRFEWSTSSYREIYLDLPIIVPKNADVRIIGTSDTNNTEAVAFMNGYLAIVT